MREFFQRIVSIYNDLIYSLICFSKKEELKADISKDFLIDCIRKQLRKYPYWLNGHISCAELLISERKFPQAYLALIASGELAHREAEKNQIDLLKMKVFNAKGAFANSIELGEKLKNQNSLSKAGFSEVLLYEELSAAYFGIGDNEKAKDCLGSIPHEKRSAGVIAALEKFDLA